MMNDGKIVGTIIALATDISSQFNGVGIKSMIFVEPNIFRFTLNDGLDTISDIPIANFNNFSNTEKALLNRFTYVNNQLLFDGQSLDKQIDLTNYVLKEVGKGLFTGNYNDLINKPASQQPNKSISFTSSDWVQDAVDTSKYTLEITHGLKTIDIVCVVYNSLGEEETIGVKYIDIDRIKLTNITSMDGRIVISYSSTIITGTSIGITDLNDFTTDDLAEGTNNKYVTTSQKAIVESINLTSPTDGQVLSYDSTTGDLVNETIFDEKVKLTASSTSSQYLDGIIDNTTIKLNSTNDKVEVVKIKDQICSVDELNYLVGLDRNLKTFIDSTIGGVHFKSVVDTKADLLSIVGMQTGDLYIVRADESLVGSPRKGYIYSSTSVWEILDEPTERDLTVNKVILTSGQEVVGILPQANIEMTGILKTTDIIDDLSHTDIDKPSSANQVKVLKDLVDTKTKVNDIGVAGNLIDTYSVDKIITLLNDKQNKIYTQSTQPISPKLNTIWIDTTNSTNYIIKCFNGSTFIQVGSSGGITIENWSTLTSYISNSNFVIYNGNLYKCKTTHISTMTFESINWDLVGGNVTIDGVQTLTNKTISATNNTISNLNTTNFASGIIDTDGALISNSDTKISTQKAIKTYIGTIINTIYPVGHILMTENSANPSTYLGVGTWVAYGNGKVPIGIDTSQTEFNTIGLTGGEKSHILSILETPSHNHANGSYSKLLKVDGGGTTSFTDNSGGEPNLNSAGTIASVGGNGAHNNLQPYIVCYMWKRTV